MFCIRLELANYMFFKECFYMVNKKNPLLYLKINLNIEININY